MNPESLQVRLSSSLSSTTYADLENKGAKAPSQETQALSKKALQAHKDGPVYKKRDECDQVVTKRSGITF